MKLAAIVEADYVTVPTDDFIDADITSEEKLGEVVAQLEVQMRDAAKKFEFEKAAALRDRIRTLKQRDLAGFFSAAAEPAPAD
jgi:excinuclease ABC subunit B